MADLATIFGGSGFVGAQIVRALSRSGWRIRVAVRRPERGYKLPLLGDVGQIQVVRADVRDRASVRAALEQASVCVNCVGILFASPRQSFQGAHVDGAAVVAEEAKAAGARALVHLSALGADPASPSAYARTKAAGEAAVRSALAEAVVLRPSIVFGAEDSFFNRFASMAMMSPALPLIGGGATRFQPVFVGDIARAVVTLLESEQRPPLLEVGGPATLSFRELMELVLRQIGRRRLLVPVSFGAAMALGAAGDILAALALPPPLTTDQVRLLRADNVVSGLAPGLEALGVTPTTLEAILPTYLWRYRRGGQYAGGGALRAGAR
ncbi:MAG TPA: complex I NDUFA9 subunit family protein [Caulobacteraceae bacterium]|nr:complex I NDUFA9 subunit family protein [Caulobacteraceae bacterium]